MLSINFMNQGDITIDVPVYTKSGILKNSSIGFASGGDTFDVVNDNINFFKPKNLDCMVFACRSSGATPNALIAFAAALGVRPIYINSQYPANSTYIANEIFKHIP